MIGTYIYELVQYGIQSGLVDKEDEIYVTNSLMELLDLQTLDAVHQDEIESRPLHLILEDIMAYALEQDILEDDTITAKDLFDTKIMGLLTVPPSVVRAKFKSYYQESPEKATDFYYAFSQATNYIRKDRIAKDEKWIVESEYGPLDITINLSKPEKDPRDIAKSKQVEQLHQTNQQKYPACLLCKENEGYAGRYSHPARQNHRIIPVTLAGEQYNLQYSPYVYYNEHCIVFNDVHTPMKIDRDAFRKLLEFVHMFPHYMIGSNADLPIVGGSILSHDHFQGGRHAFAMANAAYETEFQLKKYPNVHAGTVKWPMPVIRLRDEKLEEVVDAAGDILDAWKGYTDEAALIFAETDGEKHNTITPIARMRDGLYELDLVLRNNITTEDCPWGVYHPSADLHHIKRENIGLIEVMGLAVLPARLKKEMSLLEDAILTGKDYTKIAEIEKHVEWVNAWLPQYEVNQDNIHSIIQREIGKTFIKVLECAGVYKRTVEGQKAFQRFIDYVTSK